MPPAARRRAGARADVTGVTFVAQEQVIRTIQRDETLGLACGGEDALRVIDVYDLIRRRVEDDEGTPEIPDRVAHPVFRQVVEQLPADTDASTGKSDKRFLLRREFGSSVKQGTTQEGGLRGRTNRRDHCRFRDQRRHRQDGGPAEAVADQQTWGLVIVTEEVRGRAQVVQVGGEVGISEVALAFTQPREVEPQHGDAAFHERATDPVNHFQVL